MQFTLGFLLALVISTAAYASRSLTGSGATAAVAVGTAVYGFGGWRAALILLSFFLGSTILDRLSRRQGRRPEGAYAKGGQRDAGQVAANGFVIAGCSALTFFNPGESLPWLCLAGAAAAVNSDTWATELGAFSRRWPRLITKPGTRVRPGTSGGVSLEGSLAAACGSTLIAALAVWLVPSLTMHALLPIAAAGLIGALLDSLLGATAQSMFRCTREGVETEQHPIHRCGAQTVHVRGWSWLDNDRVNFACSACGSILAAVLAAASGIL